VRQITLSQIDFALKECEKEHEELLITNEELSSENKSFFSYINKTKDIKDITHKRSSVIKEIELIKLNKFFQLFKTKKKEDINEEEDLFKLIKFLRDYRKESTPAKAEAYEKNSIKIDDFYEEVKKKRSELRKKIFERIEEWSRRLEDKESEVSEDKIISFKTANSTLDKIQPAIDKMAKETFKEVEKEVEKELEASGLSKSQCSAILENLGNT